MSSCVYIDSELGRGGGKAERSFLPVAGLSNLYNFVAGGGEVHTLNAGLGNKSSSGENVSS